MAAVYAFVRLPGLGTLRTFHSHWQGDKEPAGRITAETRAYMDSVVGRLS